MAVAKIYHPMKAADVIRAKICDSGDRRMKRVPVSLRKNSRFSGISRSRNCCDFNRSALNKPKFHSTRGRRSRYLSWTEYPNGQSAATDLIRKVSLYSLKSACSCPKILSHGRGGRDFIGKGPVKIGSNPGFGTFFLVERRFEWPMKIPAHEVMK